MLKKQKKVEESKEIKEEKEVEEKPIDFTPLIDKLTTITDALSKLNNDLSLIFNKVLTTLDTLNNKEISVDNSETNNKLSEVTKILAIFGKNQESFNKTLSKIDSNGDKFPTTIINKDTEQTEILSNIYKGIIENNRLIQALVKGKKDRWVFEVIKDENGINKVIAES